MRTRYVCWGVANLVVLASSLSAQVPTAAPTYPADMTIIVPEVEVRCRPTKQYYVTSKMHQGERVVVKGDCKDQPGWLAIKPPPGSFSWIQAKYVKQIGMQAGYASGFVEGPSNGLVSIMPGSSVVEQKTLNVESVKIPTGSQVIILNRHNAEGEEWLQILPPLTDVRYIPAEAVRAAPPAVAVSPSGFPKNVGSPSTRPSAIPASSGTPVSANTSNWQPLNPNPQNPAPPSQSPSPVAQPAGQTANYVAAPAPMTSVQPPQWSGWGYLRKAAFEKDGRPVYVLVTREGQSMLYAVPAAGKSLQALVGRWVCLYGTINYRSDDAHRVQFMVATDFANPR